MSRSVLNGPLHIAATLLATALLVLKAPVANAADTGAKSGPAAASLESARASIKRKHYPDAIAELRAILVKEPSNADAHSLLGFSLRKSGDLNTSKVHYDEALKLDPDHKGAHEYIGELYLMRKQPDEARKHLIILERLCAGKGCEEYQDLAKALTAYKP
jgi:Flp pilus assembly protein TadD